MIRLNQNGGHGRARHSALLMTSCAAFGLLAAPGAQAQSAAQAEPSEVDEIIVTGSYRRSLEEAVDIKRNNVGFSDSIVATDVANFPEQNLAEALQRIPGVTIERNKGAWPSRERARPAQRFHLRHHQRPGDGLGQRRPRCRVRHLRLRDHPAGHGAEVAARLG